MATVNQNGTYTYQGVNGQTITSPSAVYQSGQTPGTTFSGSSSPNTVNKIDPNSEPGYKLNENGIFIKDPNYKPTSAVDTKAFTTPTNPNVIPTFEQPKYDSLGNITNLTATADYYNNVIVGQQAKDKQATDYNKSTQDLLASILSPEQNLVSAKQVSGMDAAQKLANDENAKLQAIIKQGQANQLSVVGQGRGIPEAIIGGQQAQFARETAIQALPVQASLEAAQGNLAAATATFDKLFQAKQQDSQNKLTYGFKVIDSIAQFAGEKDKIALDYVKQLEQRKADASKANMDTANQMLVTIAQNGKYNSSIGTQFSTIDYSKPDAITKAIGIAGNSLVKPNEEIIKLDNGNVVIWDKNQNKIIKTISGGTGGSGSGTGNAKNFSSLIELTGNMASLSSVTNGKNVKTSLTNMLEKQDYESAYAQIGNTIEEGLKGTTKTTFADARTDSKSILGLKNAIQAFADAGGDTGILKGNKEKISRKLLGVTGNPELTKMATALEREFQKYRVNMTGAAFSPKESRDYGSVNPSTTNNFDLNMSILDGALLSTNNYIDSTMNERIPGSSQIRELSDRTTSSVSAKSTVNSFYQSANTEVKTIIEGLFNKNYSDADVLEYLKIKGLK